jgi:hypothetical protein
LLSRAATASSILPRLCDCAPAFAEQTGEFVVSLPFRILGVLVEAPDVLETEVRDGDQVVVLSIVPLSGVPFVARSSSSVPG